MNKWNDTISTKLKLKMDFTPFFNWCSQHNMDTSVLHNVYGIPPEIIRRLRLGHVVSYRTLIRLQYVTGCPISNMYITNLDERGVSRETRR